jgi:prolipoprotein diacylglyceryltransferase
LFNYFNNDELSHQFVRKFIVKSAIPLASFILRITNFFNAENIYIMQAYEIKVMREKNGKGKENLSEIDALRNFLERLKYSMLEHH